jgi:hypothetical protein
MDHHALTELLLVAQNFRYAARIEVMRFRIVSLAAWDVLPGKEPATCTARQIQQPQIIQQMAGIATTQATHTPSSERPQKHIPTICKQQNREHTAMTTAQVHLLVQTDAVPTCRVRLASWLSKSAPLNMAPIWSLVGRARVLMRTRRAPSVVVYSRAHWT